LERLAEALVEVNKSGLTILLVAQDVLAAFELAPRGFVVELGRIGMSGDQKIRQAYMGFWQTLPNLDRRIPLRNARCEPDLFYVREDQKDGLTKLTHQQRSRMAYGLMRRQTRNKCWASA